MFQMPAEYYLHREIDVKSIIPPTLKPNDKKRLRENIQKVTLEWQLNGESIPSRVDEHVNCQVIMFFTIELTNIKHAAFIAQTLQRALKGFVILRFYDVTAEAYSFALKRLHAVQKDEVVVEEEFLTNPLPLIVTHAEKQQLIQYTTFKALQNKFDKYNVYVEMAVKAYIVSHKKAYTQAEALLQHPTLWLNKQHVQSLLMLYVKLVELRKQVTQQTKTAEKIALNTVIKQQMNQLQALLEV
ncbi:DUF4391 domain-containing protein [Lysinibacillus fusiformis]|uniref:DUF4391 domain-containing protein n=1 Tax=Lysinibacillus sp. PWR01 TaxID=3342384 RepID=UPI00372D5FE2